MCNSRKMGDSKNSFGKDNDSPIHSRKTDNNDNITYSYTCYLYSCKQYRGYIYLQKGASYTIYVYFFNTLYKYLFLYIYIYNVLN